jgi:hypothetical protein
LSRGFGIESSLAFVLLLGNNIIDTFADSINDFLDSSVRQRSVDENFFPDVAFLSF